MLAPGAGRPPAGPLARPPAYDRDLLLEGGEDLGIVSRILGHADYSTTADVYAHLTRSMLGRAANRLDATVAKAVSETA